MEYTLLAVMAVEKEKTSHVQTLLVKHHYSLVIISKKPTDVDC